MPNKPPKMPDPIIEVREEEPGFAGWIRILAEEIAGDFAARLRDVALEASAASASAGAALWSRTDGVELGEKAGRSLRELRELAGLTLEELAEAVDLEDKTLLEAVENGTASLSFELVLRLSAILARNDPIPFLIRFSRSNNPDFWRRFEGVGASRLPVQYEREREFVNILRGDDRARDLPDEAFERVLAFTREAFSLAMHHAEVDSTSKVGRRSAPKPRSRAAKNTRG
jgi:transcriptional regulator with XRE-family HTH domain